MNQAELAFQEEISRLRAEINELLESRARFEAETESK